MTYEWDLNEQLEKSWRYVGRFMWAFAKVDSGVSLIFEKLFGLSDSASLFLLSKINIDLKVQLIKRGLRHKGFDYGKTFKKVKDIIEVRNVIAHTDFVPEENGIDFDCVDSAAEIRLPMRAKSETPFFGDQTEISYQEFDSYDAEMRELWDELDRICAICPTIGTLDPEFKAELMREINSPDNVVPFPRRPKDTTGGDNSENE